jgi:hypothetical protein
MPIWANTGCCANQNERHLSISNAKPSRVRVLHASDMRAMMPEALVQRDCLGERRGRELPACATTCSRNYPKSRLRLTRMLDLLLFCLFHHTSLPSHISSTRISSTRIFSTTHPMRHATLPPLISSAKQLFRHTSQHHANHPPRISKPPPCTSNPASSPCLAPPSSVRHTRDVVLLSPPRSRNRPPEDSRLRKRI